jgi:hypothetical protein
VAPEERNVSERYEHYKDNRLPRSYLLLLTLFSCICWSREVDNYMAWGIDLEDMGPVVDQYIRENLSQGLAVVNSGKFSHVATGKPPRERESVVREKYFSCSLTAHNMMRAAFFSPTYQKIESYLDNAPGVDRYPRRPTSKNSEYRRTNQQLPEHGYMTDMEYLRESTIGSSPFYVPLSRVVNVYGVYTGADKFGHFTSFGPRYLMKFRNMVLNGASFDDAFEGVLAFGYRSERNIVGMTFTGVFSRGDLEANYQGLEFIVSLCKESSDVRLHFNGVHWELLNLESFTIEPYVNPDWDESHNNSIYSQSKWRKYVKPGFERGRYCEKLESPWVVAQRSRYAEFTDVSVNQQLEDQWLPRHFPDFDPKDHSLQHYCDKHAD